MPENGQHDGALLGVQIIRFGKFELDARSGELRSHGLRIRLQEQSLRILLMLLEHPGEVVTREQIRQRLWPDGTFVDFDHSINAAIKRLRDALGESVTRQRHLQTLPRRGYRFIGEIASMPLKVQTVGRAKERAQLLAGMASANAGNGLLLCVSGEAGIGKTTLVEQFLAGTKSAQSCLVGRARCSERLAGTGAWLPWLEALDALLADASRTGHKTSQSTVHALEEFAPTWSALVRPAISEPASHAVPSQERLKREMCAFLQQVSRFEPIVIFIDDLHWADASSGDLLTYLADRLDSMRVVVLVAYRSSDLVLGGHPFLHAKPSLEAHGRCHEIALDFLSSQEVGTYAALRFPDHRFPPTFVSLIHERTEGNPLFMVDMLRDLHQRGIVRRSALGWELKEPIARIAREVPSSVQGMIEHKIQLMHEHQPLLHLAAVQGYEFDSAIVAEVLGKDATTIEERLGHLERVHQFIRSIGERDLPDQTPSQRYRFVHVLYQNVLYASLGPARRATESKAVAEALLDHYGNRTGEIATELAFLFEAARDPMSAANYFQIASERAVANAANCEAVTLGQRGLQLLKSAPEGPDRDCLELLLYTTFGGALIATAGFDAEETARVFLRAHELCEKFGDVEQRFAVAWGLACVESVSGDAPRGFEMGAQMLRLAEEANDTGLRVAAHYVLGDLHYWRPHYQESMYHLGEAISLYHQPEHHAIGQKLIGYDPGVASIGLRAIALWYLGFPDQALRGVARAEELASPLKSPICLALTDFFTAIIHSLRREPELALSFAERALSVSAEEGFDYFEAGSLVELGWAMSLTGSSAEGIRKIREGLKLSQSIGGTLERPFLLYALAECLARTGHSEEALAVVEEGIDLARRAESHFHTPELLCLKANLLAHLTVPSFEEAEQCVCEALRMTRESGAKSLELRAAVSLCRLQRKYDRPKEWEALAGVAGFFTEGFDTTDLKDAKALLASQGGGDMK